MDEFGYLAVILSIILGLSVTQLLQGLSQVINARDRARIYGPAIGWALPLLVIDLQPWWARSLPVVGGYFKRARLSVRIIG
jgi:hypothetical protein